MGVRVQVLGVLIVDIHVCIYCKPLEEWQVVELAVYVVGIEDVYLYFNRFVCAAKEPAYGLGCDFCNGIERHIPHAESEAWKCD